MTNNFYEPYYDMESLFAEALRRGAAQRAQSQRAPGAIHAPIASVRQEPRQAKIPAHKPRMDLYEDIDANLVTAHFEFPGVGKEDIQIDVQNGRLTVAAEVKSLQTVQNDDEGGEEEEECDEGYGYVVRERRYGRMSRTVQLPAGIDEESIKASMENGLLTVTFPHRAAERPAEPQRIFIHWC